MTSSAPAPASSRRLGGIVLLLLVFTGVGVGGYFLWIRGKGGPSGFERAMAANARGVGQMEQFEYAKAEPEFAEAARLAPDWLPAGINLAIAQFNQNVPEKIAEARRVFASILATDEKNKHAHYCLGVLDANDGQMGKAYAHFQIVNAEDPDDAHTWYRLGMTHPEGIRSPQATECFEKAVAKDPYLNAARYNLFLVVQSTDPKRAAAMEVERKALVDATWETEMNLRYSVMGKYADVIGRDPSRAGKPAIGPLPMFEPMAGFTVTLANGVRWAKGEDLDPVRRSARDRFGATVVLFDFNGDGKPDVYIASAVVEGGKVRDLLLRNDGNGVFADVTAAAGLGDPRVSLGAAAGDFDNDGHPDLVITGAGRQFLFSNKGNGTFADVSTTVGLDKVKGTCLGCGWVDLDQDCDLDLILCKYSDGETPKFDGPKPGGGVLVYENIGVAPANNQPGLTTAFQQCDKFAGVVPAASATSFLASDLDNDRDVDLLVLPETADPVVVQNDRLLRFKRPIPGWASKQSHPWNGGLVLDTNHDERSDLFLIRATSAPLYLLSKGERDFTPGNTNSPTLKQAVAVDIDLDGWCDVVGLGADGKAVLLHNLGDGRLEHALDAFGSLLAGHAVAVADFDGDGIPDLLTLGDDGLHLLRNKGNGNAALPVAPSGKRDKSADMRTNADGIGTWVIAQSGSLWTGAERTTVSAGLGQSLLPTTLGLGKNSSADVVRIRWPDAVIQAELGVRANVLFRVTETNRKGTSCPVLMTWNGEKFAFVTDFLGGGALGESGPDGSVRPPRPEESVKIESGQLVPKDGQYVLKIAEPMDEVLYLDHLRLDVIDHPRGSTVFPDERFVFAPPEPTQKLLAFQQTHLPRSAIDHQGRDVLDRLRLRDRRAVDSFARRSWLGYAEDHWLELDFGELPLGGNWQIILAGWTDYPYPESMYAATRAGVAIQPPVLERFDENQKKWVPVGDLGFPAGLPRVMTRELPADFHGGKLRIATNMQIFWDQIMVGKAAEAAKVGTVTQLAVSNATLAARGFMQEVYPDGRLPVAYDDAKTEPVAVNKWKGRLTKLGDVAELLRAADDRFVLCGPGDEITVRFDATKLPMLKDGWLRSFVLRTHGYCKDTSTTTVSGGEVGPLPFRAMPNYPDFGNVKPPVTDAEQWHTRPAGR